MDTEQLNKITLKSGSIENINDEYLLIVFSDFSTIDLDELLLREQAFYKLTKGIPIPFVIDTRGKFIEYDQEAQEYMASETTITHQVRKAEAFIISDYGIKIMVTGYLSKNPTKCPSEIFTSFDGALKWIQQFL